MTFENFSVVTDGVTETTNGSIRLVAGTQDVNFLSQDSMEFNLRAVSSLEGTLSLENLRLDVANSLSFINGLIGVNGATGQIAHSNNGRVDLRYDEYSDSIEFTGAGTGVGTVQVGGRITLGFKPDANADSVGFLDLDVDDVREFEFFNETNRFGPFIKTRALIGLGNPLVLDGDELIFSLRENFTDRDGDLLTMDLMPVDVTVSNRQRQNTVLAPDDPIVALALSEVEAGVFSAVSTTNAEVVDYRFEAYVEDPTGLRSLDPLELAFTVYLDSDGDDDADRFDDDDDNDGVFDPLDDFPLDPTESLDSDRDGVGDNADPDDDNDGTPDIDDAYPFDAACFRLTDGNGTNCYLSWLPSGSSFLLDSDGIVYIGGFPNPFSFGRYTIYRYDTNQAQFLPNLELDPSLANLAPDEGSYGFAYIEGHNSLYFSYSSGVVTRIDLADANPSEQVFWMGPGIAFLEGTTNLGPYWVRFGDTTTYESFDKDGNVVDAFEIGAGLENRDYTKPGLENFCDEGWSVSPATGLYFDYSNPGLFNCSVFGDPQASPDGTLAVTQQLEVIDQTVASTATITPQETLRFGTQWTNDGIFVTTDLGAEVFGADGLPIDTVVPLGMEANPRTVILERSNLTVVVFRSSETGIQIKRYEPQ